MSVQYSRKAKNLTQKLSCHLINISNMQINGTHQIMKHLEDQLFFLTDNLDLGLSTLVSHNYLSPSTTLPNK